MPAGATSTTVVSVSNGSGDLHPDDRDRVAGAGQAAEGDFERQRQLRRRSARPGAFGRADQPHLTDWSGAARRSQLEKYGAYGVALMGRAF